MGVGAYSREIIQVAAFGGVAIAAIKSTRQIFVNGMRRARWLRARPQAIAAYFSSHAVRKLHLGCGPIVLQGWLNADVRPRQGDQIFIDVLQRLPFDDGTLDYVFSEHLIGDLTYPQTKTMLAECHRVLRPGGRLRIATPSLARLAQLYSPSTTEVHRRYVAWAVDKFVHWADAPLPGLVINNLFQEHRFVYDPATLRNLLARAGFTGVTEVRYGQSNDPHLAGIDSHGRVIGHPDLSAFESLTLEASRP
jgi:predicted SAM-dependent methyltransferase